MFKGFPSLSSIKSDLTGFYDAIQVIEDKQSFIIIANLNSSEQLTEFISSNEFSILSGAIRTLGKKSDVSIEGLGINIPKTDLHNIRSQFSKKGKVKN